MKTDMLGPLEQQVMEILWNSENPLKPQDVKNLLKGDYAYTTVMTILKRLTDKNFACRKLAGKAFLYAPCHCREDFVKTNLSGIYNGLVHSYGKLAISQFVDSLKSNNEDLELLKNYLNKK
ncbi:BlaI/MecI/CopY family transcriptional regulator [Candidatus Shapirobacteria bacterium]|nr:BlaI/MecI/CopY family transcriptional regulator [Candidatus Shapirobacteria bacterium]